MSWRRSRAFALRLHVSAAPPRVGLTQALGGRKTFDYFACQCSLSRHRLKLLFGQVVGTLLLRSSPSGALTHPMRCAGRLRKRCLVSVSASLLTLSFLKGLAESSRVRVRAFPLRLSASAPRCDLHRHPPPPNNSFKPTPCRGVSHVLSATLAHVRRPATGRLNSSVRRQKTLFQLPWLSRSTAPLIAAPLLPSTTTLNALSHQTLLRKVCGARSHIACVTLAGFGNGVWCRSVCRYSCCHF
jgi:hypothetical protein